MTKQYSSSWNILSDQPIPSPCVHPARLKALRQPLATPRKCWKFGSWCAFEETGLSSRKRCARILSHGGLHCRRFPLNERAGRQSGGVEI